MRFRRSDQRALLFLFGVFVVAWGAVLLDRYLNSPEPLHTVEALSPDGPFPVESLEALADTASFPTRRSAPSSSSSYYAVPSQSVETFPFDPNTADSTELLRLGLAPWQVRSIYRYRAKGGRWHRPDDFRRTPGMTPELWHRLGPMVRIGEAFRYYHDTIPQSPSSPSDSTRSFPYQEKFREVVTLDLNAVDTSTLKKIPGIGSVRAARIVRYRNRLGGFTSLSQLSEIPDLPAGLEQWFAPPRLAAGPLYVNKSTARELARHPYLSYTQARAITDHVRLYGPIKNLDELSLLPEFTEEELQRLAPYVSY